MDSTLFVLIRLLNKLKIAHDEEEIRLQLISEPQYPSLLSITNILDFLNIKYTPVQTTFEYLKIVSLIVLYILIKFQFKFCYYREY